jgi:hypothetical protein
MYSFNNLISAYGLLEGRLIMELLSAYGLSEWLLIKALI